MQHELGFELIDVWGFEFVRPSALSSHLEVYSCDLCPKMLAVGKGSPYT
jgi:hypothetical protein